MPDRKFTFLELHLHESDVQFGPKELDSLPLMNDSTESADESAGADDEASAESSGGRSKLLTLLLLAGLGIALRKFAGGDDGGTSPLDNVTDLGVVTGDEDAEASGTDERDEDEAVSIDVEDAEESESGGSRLRLLVGLVLVVAVAVVARKLLGGSEDLDELEALDDVRPEP